MSFCCGSVRAQVIAELQKLRVDFVEISGGTCESLLVSAHCSSIDFSAWLLRGSRVLCMRADENTVFMGQNKKSESTARREAFFLEFAEKVCSHVQLSLLI